MKKRIVLAILSIAIILLSITAMAHGSNDYKRVIVLFDDTIKPEAQNALINKHGYHLKRLRLINAAVALLPAKAEPVLAKNPGVLSIENDGEVLASGNQAVMKSSQVLPWGISAINAVPAWRSSVGSGVKVAVIDTGIDFLHPDLSVNIKGGFNTINHKASFTDDHGHGSHVAGIIAAADNDIGIIGAAPKAELYAVKVLDNTGSGRISDVIEGIQWSVDNHMQVLNMSLGTTSYSKALNSAVTKAYNSGLIMVASAGNGGPGLNTVTYPAKFSEVIAVAASDENNVIAPFSSRGLEVDIAAPGTNIYSTYNNSRYATLSGTSMSAPHVTGAIALELQLNPNLTPAQVVDRLKRTAHYLPNAMAEEQGAGLVDALALVNSK